MNKRGMTLIEMTVALAILPVASLTLFRELSAVLKVMGNSSTMKDNSDMPLSYAEEIMSNDVRDNIQIDTNEVTYAISSDRVSVPVVRGIAILNVKDDDRVHLRALEEPGNQGKAGDAPVYKEFRLSLDEFYKSIKKAREAHEGTENGDPYSASLKNVHILMSSNWVQFLKKFLPASYCSKFGAQDVYVFPYYSQEIKKSDSQYDHDGLIAMLNPRNELVDTDTSLDDYLYTIYDYDNERWYYCDQDVYRIKVVSSFLDGKMLHDVKDSDCIKSWTGMKNTVKDPKNGWKILDVDIEYNMNTDPIWRNVS